MKCWGSAKSEGACQTCEAAIKLKGKAALGRGALLLTVAQHKAHVRIVARRHDLWTGAVPHGQSTVSATHEAPKPDVDVHLAGAYNFAI